MDASRIVVATDGGLLLAHWSSGGWETWTALEGLPTRCLAGDPLRPDVLYCGTFGAGLFRSLDAGTTWTSIPIGDSAQAVTAVAVSQGERVGDHGIVYAGTEPTALYRSETQGATWRECARLRSLPSAPTWSFPPRPTTSHVRAIAPDPQWGGRLAVAIEAGALVRSFDGGQSWRDRVPDGPRDSHTLIFPANSHVGLLYAAAGDGYGQPGRGFACSRDAGATWDYPDSGLRFAYLWGLAVAPTRADVLLVSAAPSPRRAHTLDAAESALFRREGDADWEEVRAGLPPATGTLASVLATTPNASHTFFAANNVGLYRSPDSGRSWERLALPGAELFATARPEALWVW